MDAPPPNEDVRPFVAVARALLHAGLSVPEVKAEDVARGFLLLTDLGNTHYLAALGTGASPGELYPPAAAALLAMQSAPSLALGLADYDREFLAREVGLFPTWFLNRHLGLEIDSAVEALVLQVVDVVAEVFARQPQVFVHRDYHSRNLMVLPRNTPGILDFQDAIRGPVTYDLVSLYKDCYVRWPREYVVDRVESYRQVAMASGINLPSAAEFLRWFDLVGLQRHLKVLGIFARLWYRDGKAGYLTDLPRVLDYVLEVSAGYRELRALDEFLHDSVVPRFSAAQARAASAPLS